MNKKFSRRYILRASGAVAAGALGSGTFAGQVRAAAPPPTPITPELIGAARKEGKIPIVFGVGDDPVKLGLVAGLARPGGNATGFNNFFSEVVAKRLALLHKLLPRAVRVAVLVNPAAPGAETTLRNVHEAARPLGMQIRVLKASTSAEIDAAFAALARDRPDALFVVVNLLFAARAVQIATLAARDRIPTNAQRTVVEAGGLMYYGTDNVERFHQIGVYVGRILKGAKPADLPIRLDRLEAAFKALEHELTVEIRDPGAPTVKEPPRRRA
jgi:putative ABC transport system substrate-binding protein